MQAILKRFVDAPVIGYDEVTLERSARSRYPTQKLVLVILNPKKKLCALELVWTEWLDAPDLRSPLRGACLLKDNLERDRITRWQRKV
ncbi:MAG: hypothetical protein CME25_13810 [Gemmatimonadetes bacterium]|nr:hypothetical protein [Gemmatimonadota bacterium]